jgi:two-component system KDP operon response regulator KdpE
VSETGPLVLVIEDEASLRRFLRASLEANGFRVREAVTAAEGKTLAAREHPALMLLDLGLPDGDGLEVTRALREWTSTPIIVLSARGRESDKVAALDAGADDYITKPFGVGELLARVRVALRHAAAAPGTNPVVVIAGLEIDRGRHRVTVHGAEVHLTPTEFRLLGTLAAHAGKVVTHRLLLQEVWGPGYVDQPHVARVYMAQLRRKLEPDPARPRWLLTEQGVGYRLADE